MNNNYYQIFVQQVLQLAQTIVIKSTEAAEALNIYVDEQSAITGSPPTDLLAPTTWKYYLNLAGEYHHLDQLMEVVSRDTLEKITFSKENLSVHRATARDYVFGTRQYQELVAQYPQQEMLILGILNPIDIDTAVAARDGTILGYPNGLIEANEYSLVSKLQQWIDGYKIRWVNRQFNISDPLYAATSLGIMYLNLVPAIMNFRLEACKTNEAHSYHVRQYLGSHGFLDAYIDQMTIKQTLFLYRNIAYIERNVGKRETFEWLVEHIMTERYLPLAEYTMRHDLSKQPDEVYPTLIFHKKPINLGYSADLKDNLTLEQILTKQDTVARDNLRIKNDALPVIREQMENSISNVVQTKVLESSVVDNSNSSPYSLEEILVNHWLFLSTEDRYTAFIGVTNPKSGERIPMTAKEAYTFLWYAFTQSIGIDLVEIPKVYAKRVQRLPIAQTFASLSSAAVVPNPNPLPGTVDDLMSIVDNTLIDRSVAEQALSMQPDITTIISTEAFYNLCKEIYEAAQMQRNLAASQEHLVRRGMVHNMISRIYSDNICALEEDGVTYDEWFSARNIDLSALKPSDYETIYQDLVREATGLALNNENSLKDLQAAMVKMLSQLSSYSVQIIAQINNTDIKQTDWTAIRVGAITTRDSEEVHLPDSTVQPLNVYQHDSQRCEVLLLGGHVNGNYVTKDHSKLVMDAHVKVRASQVSEIDFQRVPMARINARPRFPLPTNNQGIIPVIGIEDYFALTLTQQQGLKDVYNGGYTPLVQNTDGSVDEGQDDQSLYMVPRYVAPNYAF